MNFASIKFKVIQRYSKLITAPSLEIKNGRIFRGKKHKIY